MSDLFGTHIVGFPTRWFKYGHYCISSLVSFKGHDIALSSRNVIIEKKIFFVSRNTIMRSYLSVHVCGEISGIAFE